MTHTFLLFFSGIMILSSFSIAQHPKIKYTSTSRKAIKFYENAIEHYSNIEYNDAEADLLKAIANDSLFVEAYTLLGELYGFTHKYNKAAWAYKKAIVVFPEFFPGNFFNLANIEFSNGQYGDALEHYRKFITYPDIAPKHLNQARNNLKCCAFALDALKQPVSFNPVNLGDSVNTHFDEYLPALTADEQTLIFTVQHPADADTYYPHDGTEEDFFICRKKENRWTKARKMAPPLNTPGNEGAHCISPDGQVIIFTGCNRTDSKGSCDLYFAKKTGDLWSRPMNLGPPINTFAWESQPTLSSDGKTLYFVSNRPGGLGEKDIWKSELTEDGYWGNPLNLGDIINTPGMEQSPFIHPDNQTLYFSSDGHIGMGGEDIYYSKSDSNHRWSDPVNLGYPINTNSDEWSLFVSASGTTAYFASGKDKGNLDLYYFTLPSEARPQPVTYVKGIVSNSKTGEPLDVKFELMDLQTGEVIVQSYSNRGNGDFLVCLPIGKEYALNASKKGFLFYSDHFSLTDTTGSQLPFLYNVSLQPIEIGNKIILKNIFYETDKYDLKPESKAELGKLIVFLRTNPTVSIEISGHTDNVGKKDYNLTLSKNRSKAVYDYLLTNGISAGRISFKGYGDAQPEFPNDTDENRSKNRRTEFRITGL